MSQNFLPSILQFFVVPRPYHSVLPRVTQRDVTCTAKSHNFVRSNSVSWLCNNKFVSVINSGSDQ